MIRRLTGFFYEIGTLRKIARSHRQTLLTDDLSDNIASHSFRTSAIGWFLAKAEKADPYKVLLMCTFHDVGESRSGDQNWINKKYLKVFEDEITDNQMENVRESGELKTVIGEYQKRETVEAKIAKDADLLDQILLLREYAWKGNQEAAMWLVDNEQEKRLYSSTVKKLAREIMTQNPSWWWNFEWSGERRK